MKVSVKAKKYIYAAIALLLVAAAVFFAVYSNYGQSYNYAKKDLDRFVSSVPYAGNDISSITLKEVNAKAVNEEIAKLLKAKASTTLNSTSVSAGYDLVVINYYMTDDEGKIISDPALMSPEGTVKVQLQSADELYTILMSGDPAASLLAGIKGSDYSYNTVTSGYLAEGDIVYLTYTVSGGTEVKYEKATLKAAMDTDYGTGFYVKLMETPIGKKLENETFGDKVYDAITVNWAARTELSSGTAQTGDVVFATVTTTTQSNETITYYVRTNGTATIVYNSTASEVATLEDAVISAISTASYNSKGTVEYAKYDDTLTAFDSSDYYTYEDTYTKVTDTTGTPVATTTYYTDNDGVKTECVKPLPAFEANTEYYTKGAKQYVKVEGDALTAGPIAGTDYYRNIGKFSYTVNDIVRAGATENITEAMKGIEHSYTYPEDSTAKDYAGNELKGKTVTYHVYPKGINKLEMDYTNIATLTTVLTSDNAKALIAAYTKNTAYDTAYNTLSTALGTSNSAALNVYTAAMREYKDSTAETPDATALDAARANLVTIAASNEALATAMEKAYDELATAIKAYKEGDDAFVMSSITSFETFFDTEANKILPTEAEAYLKKTNEKTYRVEVAKLLWEKMVAEADIKELPSRARRLAYNDQIDLCKSEYFEKKYTEYSSFRKYMIATYGADYKDQMHEKADAAVKELLVIYYMADKFSVDLSDEARIDYFKNSDWSIYYSYYYSSAPEQFDNAYAFDKVIDALLDSYENLQSYEG